MSPKALLLLSAVIMVAVNARKARGNLVIPGAVTFRQRWSDFKATAGTSQYRAMTRNIENAIRQSLGDMEALRNISVTQLREDKATKKTTTQGYLTAEFNLAMRHADVTRLQKWRDMVRDTGHLGELPVKRHSLHLKELQFRQSDIPLSYNTWPSGSYGLPKPMTGCHGDKWREGFRYHDTENNDNQNNQSAISHLAGNVTLHGIRQEFCIHEGGEGEERLWPQGQYCIYKKGALCPAGLNEGWIRWDDENSDIDFPNSEGGSLPEGIYGENTVIYYCCDGRGDTSTPIWLPSGGPFYLMPFISKTCQSVHRLKATLEFRHFDDEDHANRNQYSGAVPYGITEDKYNTRIYYCYYTPVNCDSDDFDDPSCPVWLPSEEQGTNKMMEFKADRNTPNHAFAVGSGVGLLLMGTTAFCVMLKRFVTRSTTVYYY
ncbi:uncharacterized protein LOC5514562 isoform X2 [Nematostella vectensis]|uniref:uncharacterized protein LOC5514562 isoform X2 n=1 Tax=Nematostella vectensis TaxID=45351 RepID=UPI002076F9D8|nr:uncharacterized protein LOC5514562 isoform X2 [Nematostella vectensis]